MDDRQDLINKDIPKEKFDFVQQDKKIYDQAFQGKPIGYLQDVWIRFRKNRLNLIASSILFVMILFSIIMPGLSGKEYIKLNEKLSFLPPRLPILEKFGILDGTVLQKDKHVDLSKIDEETGLYLPKDYIEKAIVKKTLTNETIESTDKTPNVLGGQSVMMLDYDSTKTTVESNDFYILSKFQNPYIELDVLELDPSSNGRIDLLLQANFGMGYEVVASVTEAGKHRINVFELNEDLTMDIISKLRIRYSSDQSTSAASIASVALYNEGALEPTVFDEGYKLSRYKLVDGGGSYYRQNAEMIVASFRYNMYVASFGLTYESAFPSDEYDELIEKWGAKVEIIPNPDNPRGWFFSEGFPIREVVKKNDTVVVGDEEYSSYEVYLDYAAYLGYSSDKLPYYLFGTSQAGRDSFSLVWVGLRTSLYIGFLVTLINVSIGIVYGAISGYYGGTVDLLMQRFAEFMNSIPWLVVLAILVALFNPGIKSLMLTMVIAGWVGPAVVTRMQFYRFKGQEYVLASRTMGAKDARLIFRHILPNGIGTIITASILGIPSAIFTEAVVSFLGYGIGHGQSFEILGFTFSGVSIGVLLSDARNFLVTQPYLTVFPAIIVSILLITFNLFGNALRDAFNPSLRGADE